MVHRVAVVGLGNISDSHITGWKRLDGVEVALVVDVDPERAQSKADRYGIDGRTTEFRSVLERGDIDIVDICLPHHLHAPYVCRALEAGKHALVEKPIATTLADAKRMTETAEKSSRKLMVAENVRFLPVHARAKALIEGGELGRSFMLTTRAELYAERWKFEEPHANWRNDPEKVGGGVMLTTGIHSVSLARSLMGEIVEVFAQEGAQTREEIPVENNMHTIFKFASGATGQGSFSWAARWLHDKVDTTIFGIEGTLGVDIAKDEAWLERGKERRAWVEHPMGPYQAQWELIEHFVECIDHDRTPLTDGNEETKTLKVVLAAYRSAREGRVVRVDELA